MFLDITKEKNESLISAALELHQLGKILPDTYVIDVDAIVENARLIKNEADKYGIKLYYMTKQLGRNPYICKLIEGLGYEGAVVVDYKEARVLHDNGIKIGHIGHLVQVPDAMLRKVIEMKPQIITVYSVEKALKINEAAKKAGIVQDIMLKVYRDGDMLYPGQYSGFNLDELKEISDRISELSNVTIAGVTHFPCFLYDKKLKKIRETPNMNTILKAKKILEGLGIKVTQLNTPSSTCVDSMEKINKLGGTHGEPGHGLSGTTPYHKENVNAPEKPAIVYVSEVSHNFKGKAYIYGGGHYRRSYMEGVLLGTDVDNLRKEKVRMPEKDVIDYYFELDRKANVGESAIMSFRTQLFVTRSDVALLEGISKGKPKLIGIYDTLGRRLS